MNTFLVIDDSEVDRYLARRILAKSGAADRIFEIPSAVAALDLLSNRVEFEAKCGPCPPPVVLMLDINMPRMNGFEFLEELAERVERGEIATDCLAVAIYTSSSDQRDIERALKYPLVVDYITKPVTVEAISRIAARVAAIQSPVDPA